METGKVDTIAVAGVSVSGPGYYADAASDGHGYARSRSERKDSDAIRVLSPRMVPMSAEQLEEASTLLAELLVEYVLRERAHEKEGGQ